MSDKFQPIDRDPLYLLPPSIQAWLPEAHLARFVIDSVDQFDLRELGAGYDGGSKQPCHPALLLSLSARFISAGRLMSGPGAFTVAASGFDQNGLQPARPRIKPGISKNPIGAPYFFMSLSARPASALRRFEGATIAK